jgi:hypothetical protein
MISQCFTRGHYARSNKSGNVIETHEHAGEFKEWCVLGNFTDCLEPFAVQLCLLGTKGVEVRTLMLGASSKRFRPTIASPKPARKEPQ